MASMTPLPQLQPMENPMEQYGRVVALKSMLQQQQLRQQQEQQLQQQMAFQQQAQPLELQQKQNVLTQQQMDIGSEKAMVRAYNETGGDLQKAVPLAMSYGALPKDLNAAVQQDLDIRD